MKRVFLIVLDSLGVGALPDAPAYGDTGANTVGHIAADAHFRADTLCALGCGNIEGLSFLGAAEKPLAAYGRCMEQSAGKDTTVGHWEIAGLISGQPFRPTPRAFRVRSWSRLNASQDAAFSATVRIPAQNASSASVRHICSRVI